jgi:hypothetical protein
MGGAAPRSITLSGDDRHSDSNESDERQMRCHHIARPSGDAGGEKMLTRKQRFSRATGAAVLLMALFGTCYGATAQAEAPKWFVGKSTLVTQPTAVVLTGKLTFRYEQGGTKFVTKCMTEASGTISNSGPNGEGVDELTGGKTSDCVYNKPECLPEEHQDLNFRAFPWPGVLLSGVPARDELDIREVYDYCGGGLAQSSGGDVTPLVKSSGLVFDKGHGLLEGNGGITVSGKWKIRTTTGEKVGSTASGNAAVKKYKTDRVAKPKKPPVVLEDASDQPLAVGTETFNFVAVRWGDHGNSEQCDFTRNGSLDANVRPTLTEFFEGQSHESCYLKEASASGSLYSAKYSDKGTVTWYAKPVFTVTLAGCTYQTARIVMMLDGGSEHSANGATTDPGASFKLKKKLSGPGCAATPDFVAESLFSYIRPSEEHWAKIEY